MNFTSASSSRQTADGAPQHRIGHHQVDDRGGPVRLGVEHGGGSPQHVVHAGESLFEAIADDPLAFVSLIGGGPSDRLAGARRFDTADGHDDVDVHSGAYGLGL